MDKSKFYSAIRPAFGGKLDANQVSGMDALLDAGKDLPLQHMAYVLANVRRETGGGMYPIKETVMPWHKDKNPSDAEVKRRLDEAWRKDQLTGVKAPYWRDGAFGRGQIQLSRPTNYAKFGISNYSDALKLPVSAHIAVVGMRDGLFTGRALSGYVFPAAVDHMPSLNPRRIVNGNDGSDKEVAGFHKQFAAALVLAGWGVRAPPMQPPFPIPDPLIPIKPQGRWAAIFAAIVALFK